MNTSELVAYLINGGLIAILQRGHDKPPRLWIRQHGSAFILIDVPIDEMDPNVVGGLKFPKQALEGKVILDSKKEEVTAYLINSFVLSMKQALRVISEAHEGQP